MYPDRILGDIYEGKDSLSRIPVGFSEHNSQMGETICEVKKDSFNMKLY